MRLRPAPLRGFLLVLSPAILSCNADPVEPAGPALEITISTTGAEPDPDGYTVQVDAEPARRIQPAEKLLTRNLQPGGHSVYVGGVAGNCAVSGANPRTVIVGDEGATSVTIEVICAQRTGSVLVTTRSQGPVPFPNGQTVLVDGVPRAAIDTGIALIGALLPGSHVIGLEGVASHCSSEGNPRTITVRAEEITAVEFPVFCLGLHGRLDIGTESYGQWNPDGYAFVLEGKSYRLGPGASVYIEGVAAGTHTVQLLTIPPNCTVLGDNPATVNVPAGGRGSLVFKVFCDPFPPGAIEVSVSTTGAPVDPFLTVFLNGMPFGIRAPGETTLGGLQPGLHIVQLAGYAGQCTLEGVSERTVDVRASTTTRVLFALSCPAAE